MNYLSKNALTLLMVPMALLALGLLSIIFLTVQVGQSNYSIAQDYQVDNSLQRTLARLTSLDTNANAYITARNPILKADYLSAREDLEEAVYQLSSLQLEESQQARAIKAISDQTARKIEVTDSVVAATDSSAATAMTEVASSEVLSGDVRARIASLSARLNSELANQLQQQALRRQQLHFFSIGLLVLLLWSLFAWGRVVGTLGRLNTKSAEALRGKEKALENAINRFEAFMSNLPAVAWIKDPDGRIKYANEAFFKAARRTPENVIGRPVSDLVSDDVEMAKVKEADRAILEGGSSCDFTFRHPSDDGTEHYWHIISFPILLEGSKFIGGVAWDITEQVSAHEQNRSLTEELKSRVSDLEKAKDKAVEAAALKSAFIANISHEIRTPLSGIIGMNELLLNTELLDEQRSLAETVRDSSRSLLTVLNDILDISKLESGKVIFEIVPFNLLFVVQDSARLLSAAAQAKNLTLISKIDHNIPELVEGDPDRLRQVLINLIGNAIKFTDLGSVAVQATVIDDADSAVTVRFTVSDTGIGIQPDDMHRLFMPFSQLDDSTTRRVGGTGLGLAISQNIVKQMGGLIQVQSSSGVGSTFFFDLSFGKRHVAGEHQYVSKPLLVDDEPLVLVVEDNKVLQALAVKQLASLGLQSLVVADGNEAVKAVEERNFSFVLMDVNLPLMNGFEATKSIRTFEDGHKHTPIIAMTALAMPGDKEKCFESGMDDYVSKPVSMGDLRRVVARWVNHNEPRTEGEQTESNPSTKEENSPNRNDSAA